MNDAVPARATVIVLLLTALGAALLVMLADGWLREAREQARRDSVRLVLQRVPMSAHDNDPVQDVWSPPLPATAAGIRQVHRARNGGQPVGAYMTVIAPGYSGDITLLLGVRADGRITGVQVLEQHETLGFGDRIEREDAAWMQRFAGRSLEDPEQRAWEVDRDGGRFDAISGATVTSRAVIHAVRDALAYFAAQRSVIFAAP